MSTMTQELTVLIVEDEDSFVDALTVGLRREGFRVQVARDGGRRSTCSTPSRLISSCST